MTCPLCGSDEPERLGTVSISDCVRRLGLPDRPSDLVEAWSGDRCELMSCTSCRLEYFSPVALANARFYQALDEDQSYYQAGRWDHRAALRELATPVRLIDLGCGNGSFVRQVLDRGGHATGVDFAAEVAGLGPEQFMQARADLRDDSLAEIRERCGQVDVVTAFQLLEHLSDPVNFASRAVELLVPGGRLMISVPNRERFEIDPMQLLDCPPHHQTRWSAAQLRELGRAVGLELLTIRSERVLNPALLALRLARRLRAHVDDGWKLPAAAGPWPASRLINGMSLLAVYGTRGGNVQP